MGFRFTQENWEAAIYVSGGRRCFWCGRAEADGPRWCNPYDVHPCGHRHHDPLELDHLVPRARGGGEEPWNLVVSCGRCNRGRSARSIRRHHGIDDCVVIELVALRADCWIVAQGVARG